MVGLSMSLDSGKSGVLRVYVFLALKLSLTVLFTYLQIILLQYFQFSVINGIQTDPK